ncbi:MAG: hypothetical protein MJ137_06195 [Clostridia bacterium]|nr:hypothetical protein [Clostridia bacterium]
MDCIDDNSEEPVRLAADNLSRADFERYVTQLSSSGFITDSFKNIGANSFLRVSSDDGCFYLFYSESENRLFIEEISDTVTPEAFSSSSHPQNLRAEFYLYGLNMDPGGYNPKGCPDSHLNTTGLPNCGQILIIRAKDNSVIIIDGGLSSQWKNGALEELNSFLHLITRTPSDGTVTISCWVLTHFHNDHMDGFIDLLKAFPTSYRLERIYCNLPTLADYPRANNIVRMKELAEFVGKNHPDCIELKAQTGESINLGGVSLLPIYTHSDADFKEGQRIFKDPNDTSMAFIAKSDGMSWMILGDIAMIAEETILNHFSGSELKSDIVQVAHHCFNPLSRIYAEINAPIACFTQAEKGTVKNDFLKTNSNYVKEYSSKLFYSGDISLTVGFAADGDEIKVIFRGKEYITDQ